MENISVTIDKEEKIVKDFFNINPHKHWNFLLYIFFILVTILIMFSLFLLYQIKNEQIFQVTVGQQENSMLIKESLLKNINDLYERKAQKTGEINNNPSPYSDPSL